MRVLWLCSKLLEDRDRGQSGTWLGAMARSLLDSAEVELGIVAPGPSDRFARSDFHQIKQWTVPIARFQPRNGLPAAELDQMLLTVNGEFRADLVHTWGTEYGWGLLMARGLLGTPALLEMQGLKMAVANVFYGGLSAAERWRCIGLKELCRACGMFQQRQAFEHWGLMERAMIRGHRFIGFQSPWMGAHVRGINPEAQLFKTERALRAEFETGASWQWTGQPTVFASSAYPSPFKGLHVAVRAVGHLLRRCPDVRLRIAGPFQQSGFRQDGYVRWINHLIRDSGLKDHVDWLGALTAAQIVRELQTAGAALISSYVESYCLTMAEAMRIGTPTVTTFTGGTAHLGRDEETCLFFSPGDIFLCASHLERVLRNRDLATRLSVAARRISTPRHDAKRLVQSQISTYKQVLGQSEPRN